MIFTLKQHYFSILIGVVSLFIGSTTLKAAMVNSLPMTFSDEVPNNALAEIPNNELTAFTQRSIIENIGPRLSLKDFLAFSSTCRNIEKIHARYIKRFFNPSNSKLRFPFKLDFIEQINKDKEGHITLKENSSLMGLLNDFSITLPKHDLSQEDMEFIKSIKNPKNTFGFNQFYQNFLSKEDKEHVENYRKRFIKYWL